MDDSFIKLGVVYMGIHISRCLKGELAWAVHKQLQVISDVMLFKTVIPLRNKRMNPF